MTLQVMHLEHRALERVAQSVTDARTHQQRTRQTGPRRYRNGVEVSRAASGIVEHPIEQWQNTANVVARSQLGHYTTVGDVHVHLRVQPLRE